MDEIAGNAEDWTVAETRISPNEAAQMAEVAMQRARTMVERAQEAWLGARLALLLQEHPWLEACTIFFDSEPEYDDQGGTFWAICGGVDGVEAIDGAALPAEIRTGYELDEDLAANVIREGLEDEFREMQRALRLSMDRGGRIEVSRKALAEVIVQSPISGREVFRLLQTSNAFHLS